MATQLATPLRGAAYSRVLFALLVLCHDTLCSQPAARPASTPTGLVALVADTPKGVPGRRGGGMGATNHTSPPKFGPIFGNMTFAQR